jgi:hypothetical protein
MKGFVLLALCLVGEAGFLLHAALPERAAAPSDSVEIVVATQAPRPVRRAATAPRPGPALQAAHGCLDGKAC